ncbi:titin isoform X2 [Drosophila miranda]|uniref:titin isoform X2 n=1 Tax=Drosophila miranda TaxID=7229 RepID=UPI00143F1068|nr:titin isoform X2 [Drosophila miranda]
MSETKKLLDKLLCDIYGQQEELARRRCTCHSRDHPLRSCKKKKKGRMAQLASGMTGGRAVLEKLNVRQVIDVVAILKVEILMMGYMLETALIARDRLNRHQEGLCKFIVIAVEKHDAQPKMRFSLSPPPRKASLTSPTSSTTNSKNRSTATHNMLTRNGGGGHESSCSTTAAAVATDEDAASDYNQWLHAMKLVARLPGGTPPEFRRKLWLSLADKYLKSKNVDWAKQREKCFCEEWREDDEELGIQIVKDLHRTGSNLCTGPAGSINQAKLKRILLGYARYNPEVGYCQGFNMLGALILQVMDKEEEESMKVMIYLVEGVLPTGYFYGSMGGLQADMGVFRELMQTRLPRLAKHLQRLQGPVENAYEPPLTNVFTMQWFLTMFCTCLPMSCVLRVWDLVLIEGSDVILRTALVLWSLLEERVLSVRSADEFYGKMGSYSSELLNGHLIDSNGLIERVVKLGPIADLRQLRDKHLYNIAPLRHQQGMQLYYDDEDTHSDEERMAVATVWGLNWGRRGSVGPAAGRQPTEPKDRMALDISLLKKQYDRLRERQKQAHVILTTACSTAARQGPPNTAHASVAVNQLLLGRPAIITNKGKRVSAPLGAIPPARKPSLPAVLHTKPSTEKQLRRGETLLWRDTDPTLRRRDSLTWKEIKAERAALVREGADKTMKTQKLRSRFGKSDSSSYSEDSDGEQEQVERAGGSGGSTGGGGSSTDTSLCDDDDPKSTEKSPKQKARLARKLKEKPQLLTGSREASLERQRPKSWAPSSHEIPFMLMGTESGDEKEPAAKQVAEVAEDSATESGRFGYEPELASKMEPLHLLVDTDTPGITSTSQLSPMPDMTSYLGASCISPLPTPRPVSIDPLGIEGAAGAASAAEEQGVESTPRRFDFSEDGVTNQYFERVNSVERPSRLELSYSLNEEGTDARAVYMEQRAQVEGQSGEQEAKAMSPPQIREDLVDADGKVPQIRDDNIPGENKDDYKEVLSMTIESQQPPPPTAAILSNASRKRHDPRRKTLTRSSTIDIEERFQALEHRFSQEQSCDKPKYIPSTAALEERFETLEKQLSAEKVRKELEEVDPELAEKSERIPSTADLESRFDALTKQMSSSESSSKAPPVDLGDAEQSSGSGAKEQKDSEKTSKLHRSEDSQSETKDTATTPQTENSKGTETDKNKEDKEGDQPRLRKLPSTAELEDRFNALERKMSVQNSSPAKTKKEPPDEEPAKEEPKARKEPATEEPKARKEPATDEPKARKEPAREEPKARKEPEDSENRDEKPQERRALKDSKDSEESNKQNETVKGKDRTPTKTPEEKEASKRVEPKASGKDSPDTKVESEKTKKKPEPENVENQEEPVKTPRKSPPSTEELEKRFNALEKQLSTTNLESSKEAEQTKSTAKDQRSTEARNQKEAETAEREQKSTKTFEEKLKEVNSVLTNDQKKSEVEVRAEEKRKSFEERCKSASKTLETKEKEVTASKKTDEIPSKKAEETQETSANNIKESHETKTENTRTKNTEECQQTEQKDRSKRRASEPPSTEDLEKRYETLKRRMSSKNHFSTQSETVNQALERIEQEVISECGEDRAAEKKQPPSTEDLESRFEALHGKDKAESKTKSQPKLVDVAIEAHIPSPPPAPPLPPAELRILAAPTLHQQQALIEELQSKMQGQGPGEENLKPSQINPQRKQQQRQRQLQLQQRPTTMGDETSEAPANTAYYRSGNDEPWQQRTVRRFSDLPSRADLVNRLQFLEKQLYMKFYKQRCASDSEVASKANVLVISADGPSTSRQALAEGQLEQRVLALEKQLSENSLKLLEAMREKSAAAVAVAPQSEDSGSPRRLSTDTIDATTGKELVRYTQNFSELEEVDSHKPINISINIKMMVNKDSERKRSESKSTTEDLARRIEQLEAQLVEERAKNGAVIPENEALEEPQPQPDKPDESEASKKQEKDCHNQNVKSDETVRLEDLPPEGIEPETVKETKTLENEEIAQARAKEVDGDKTAKEAVVDPKSEVQEENTKQEEVIKPEHVEEPSSKEMEPPQAEKDKPNKNEETKAKKCCSDESTAKKKSSNQQPEKNQPTTKDASKEMPDKMVTNGSDTGPVDASNKTVVLLMDNEPKASRLRRLTRANTEELEDLFQALEKQLNDRNLIKSEDGRLIRAESKPSAEQVEQAQAITDLTKQIEDYTSGNVEEEKPAKAAKEPIEDKPEAEEPNDYDWGPNPVKHHLKRKTVYLPSTKELEARFRSLERQIKLLEDVEKIDVEQRLKEIERKIKLQYSLSHEKDLNKYLDLCEGKGLDDDDLAVEETPTKEEPPPPATQRSRSPARKTATKSPYTSPSRKAATKSPYNSPSRKAASKSPYSSPYTSPYTSPSRQRQKTPGSSPTRASEKKAKRSPYTSPVRRQPHPNDLPISDDLEFKYRVLDLVRSKSKENLARRMNDPNRKPPIHPLEMLLDPSPDSSEIPTTGELEHRIRLLDEKLKSPVRPSRHKSRSRSPTIEDIKRKKMLEEQQPRTPVHNLERLVSSPGRPEPPTAEELDVRMRALEEEHSFDFKTQKDYKAFNQKLKDVISPSISFEEFKSAKSREQSPRRGGGATTPKSAMRRDDPDDYRRDDAHSKHTHTHYRPTSPKVIRFRDEDEDYFEEASAPRPKSRQSSERMKTLADQPSSIRSYSSSSAEGLDALGSRLMRETSPITRTGTHTGVPLRTTGENINDRLSSIKNSIKSIDTLCEEKPYQKEKCQRYIDSLFTDSLHFASKKSSVEDLAHSRSESRGRTMQRSSDYTPSIRITSEHRSLGSAESRRSLSPLGRDVSPLHHRSHRDISRDLSPRRRRGEQEDREEREERESSRVRRDNMLPNYFADNRSELSSGSSLTKFHKVDRQLEETCAKYADDRRSACRTPLSSPYETRSSATRHTTTNYNYNSTTTTTTTGTTIAGTATATDSFPRPVSPYRQPYDPYRRPNAPAAPPAYQPAKLEIRHTTVTSTFYDRFLTEKQIEKQTLSRPPSRSPVVSPSVTTKSYSDLYQSISTTSSTSTPITTTGNTSFMSSSYAGPSFSQPGGSNYSYLSTHTAGSGKSLSPIGGSSSSDLRLHSTDNLLASTTTSASAITTSSSFVPYNFSSSLGSRLTDPISSCSAASVTTTSSLTYSTGVYNPMMSFTLREPLTSSSLGGVGVGTSPSLLGQYQFKTSFGSGYTPKTPTEQDKP